MKKIVQQLKYCAAALLLVFATSQSFAQNIANPDFEILTTANNYPNSHSQLSKAASWFSPTQGSPDYFYGSHYRLAMSADDVTLTPIIAKSGEAYVGGQAEIGGSDGKEYITNKLSAKLTAGVTYTISFYTMHAYGRTSNPDFSLITFTDMIPAERGFLGICFSNVAPTTTNTQSNNSHGSIINSWNSTKRALIPASNTSVYGTASRNTWVPVTLTYTADGTEEYMTLGQFREGASALRPLPYGNIVYYLYDSFSPTISPVTPVLTSTNPTTPGGTNGSVTLSPPSGSSYPANTPVTVTYTKPDGTTATYNGTTDATGKVTVPGLPAGTYNNFTVAFNGGPASSPSGPVTLVAPPATPVPTGTNPTTPGGTNGSVTLSPPSGSSYPANTPLTVTYTKPDNTTATYTGTSDGTGKVTIPNLPAGTYTNFTVAFNDGPASGPSGPVTLSDCAANAGTITRQ